MSANKFLSTINFSGENATGTADHHTDGTIINTREFGTSVRPDVTATPLQGISPDA